MLAWAAEHRTASDVMKKVEVGEARNQGSPNFNFLTELGEAMEVVVSNVNSEDPGFTFPGCLLSSLSLLF